MLFGVLRHFLLCSDVILMCAHMHFERVFKFWCIDFVFWALPNLPPLSPSMDINMQHELFDGYIIIITHVFQALVSLLKVFLQLERLSSY